MFNQNEIDAYRKLSAPSDLRDKVLSSSAFEMPKKRNVNKIVRRTSTIAACLVLVFTLSVFTVMHYGNVDVSISDDVLSGNSTLVYSLGDSTSEMNVEPYGKKILTGISDTDEESDKTCIPLTLKGHADISVSSGVIAVMQDACSDEILSEGTTCSIDGETSIRWTVYANEGNHTFEMLICSPLKTEKIILIYQPDSKTWTVTRQDAE